MSVGQSSLIRANNGVVARKVVDDGVKPSEVIEVNLSDLVFVKKKVSSSILSSIQKYGLICPVIAVKSEDKLKVIDGALRLSALDKLGATTVKVLILEGNAEELKKELSAFKKSSTEATPKSVIAENIHEEKFKAVSGIYSTLPDWLL